MNDANERLPPDARAFLAAMNRRYACKLFDGTPLDQDIEVYILECGRLSPSSFGLEHWKFVASRETTTKERLFAACFGQDCVRTAGLVVSTLVRREAAYDPDGGFVRARSERFPGGHPVFRADYIGYWEFLRSRDSVEDWAKAQVYIAVANMMTGAAAAGVDSCAIEGFDEEKVLEALGQDSASWRVGLVAVFGKSAETSREKIREPFESVVEYRP
jgi:nitroreductase